MSGFHDILFPMRLAVGASGGPQWPTEIIKLASGKEVRNSKWSRSRRRWDIGSGITNLARLQEVIRFFEARRGPLFGFRFRDPLDSSSAPAGQPPAFEDQVIGVGDGAATQFQLVKDLEDYARKIEKPVLGSVSIGLGGQPQLTGWDIDHQTGIVRFETPPPIDAPVTAGFQFDCAVRFENDQIQGVIEAFSAGRVISLTLVELL
ncbi:MAG: DUF2460 domain-containing protein [Pseudomonadota bacterium]